MFIETPRFPDDVSYGSSGGPKYSTTVIEINSGHEQRNINWNYPRREYDVALGVREEINLEALISMFHITKGRAHGFRYKDWHDYKTCPLNQTPAATDQALGTGNGATTTFQLVKTYTLGSTSTSLPVYKPVGGTVKVAINGVNQTSGWSVNTTTGIVTFSVAPANGAVLTWGGEYDIPVRFNTDTLSTRLETYRIGSASVPLTEIRL